MRRTAILTLLAVGTVFSAACSTSNPVIEITGGKIVGVVTDSTNVIVYKGIPYAAPPVGENRWKRPQPVIPWEGVRSMDTFGKISLQGVSDPDTFYGKEFYAAGMPEMSEDCLYLNIWAPANSVGNANAKLPVAMWIHGGAFVAGYGHEISMDGDAWAKRGVILVTINYRLGSLGFFSHPLLSAEDPDGVSGDYGLYDQVAALEWIRDNIAQFGGDPSNVTIFGQSAGAVSVKDLVISPLTKGLIAKAIIESGGGVGFLDTVGSLKEEEAIGKAILDEAGINSLEQMRSLPAEDLMDMISSYKQRHRMRTDVSPFPNGHIIKKNFVNSTLDNTIPDIPYMIGYTANDMGVDFLGGAPVHRFCEVRDSLGSAPVFEYEFARPLPGDNAGAFHSSELWYIFNTLKNSWRPFTEADYVLSEEMVDYWTNFAKYGDPDGKDSGKSWPAFTREKRFRKILDTKKEKPSKS